MLTTSPNDTMSPYHDRMPFIILRPEQHPDWLGSAWEKALGNPDRAALKNIHKQLDLL